METAQMDQIFEDVVATIREPLLVLDSDLRAISANRSFYDFFKVKPEETVGQLIYDLGNKQWDIPKLRELLETILPQKTSFDNYEVEHAFATIGRRIMLLNARQIEQAMGKERIILLAIEDITERKQIETGLEKTRKELEAIKKTADEAHEFADSLINTVREPLISLDQDLRVVNVSRSFYEFFKVKPEETVGQLIYDLGNKQWDIPRLRELLETILPQQTSFDNYEVEHDFPTIGRRVMLLNARQIQRGIGKERIILLAIEDITERKRLEDMLTDSEERYRRLFETADDGILLLEKHELKIRHANPAITATLGYSNEECIGNDLKNIGFPDNIGSFNEVMQTLNGDGIIYFKDVPVQKKDGQVVDTDIYMVDRARLVQCNIRNITEFKRMEGQLHQSQKMESIGTLAGGIAHDFNNILAIIIGNTEMAIEAVPEWNSAREYLNEIKSASTRATDLIRHILSFSHKGKTHRKPIKLGFIIEDLLKMLRATIPADIEIRQNLSCESDMILADPTQIGQVLMNICTNAAHAMHDKGGILEVRLQNVEFKKQNVEFDLGLGRYVKLAVSDTGHGIDPKNIGRIFDPYFTTKGLGEGTGLGLSMVQGIVKMHSGAVTVKSAPGKGTVFEVLFPLTEADVLPEHKKAEDFPTGNEKILLIDDEASILKLVKKRLEMQGFQVEAKNNPVEALELFRSEPDRFDLIITDMTMPNMTGEKLAKELLNIRPEMPIILCSGYSDRINAEKAAAIGIRQYIEKPMNMSGFMISIRKVLDQAKASTHD